MAERNVLLIRETVWESIASDGFTFIMVMALVGLGRVIESTALQWVGAIAFFAITMNRAKLFLEKRTFTVAEARAELDRIEREARQ